MVRWQTYLGVIVSIPPPKTSSTLRSHTGEPSSGVTPSMAHTACWTELKTPGWMNKMWTTRKGITKGGTEVPALVSGKCSPILFIDGRFVTRPNSTRRTQSHGDEVMWKRVQSIMATEPATVDGKSRTGMGTILRGLMQCTPCGVTRTPSMRQRGKCITATIDASLPRRKVGPPARPSRCRRDKREKGGGERIKSMEG